jgi:hypothetical protein
LFHRDEYSTTLVDAREGDQSTEYERTYPTVRIDEQRITSHFYRLWSASAPLHEHARADYRKACHQPRVLAVQVFEYYVFVAANGIQPLILRGCVEK